MSLREMRGDYFSPLSTTFTLPFRLARAAASLATGIRQGEQSPIARCQTIWLRR